MKACCRNQMVLETLSMRLLRSHLLVLLSETYSYAIQIGSSPGFVDSDFESAKLLRPAASFFNSSDGCLYFVDSENNAIRRADMERRLVETMYPVPKATNIWGQILHVWDWILNISRLSKDCMKQGKFDLDSLESPWHLLQVGEDEFVIISLSFGTAWVMSRKTWTIKEVLRGFPKIFENYGYLIMAKLSLLGDACGVFRQKFSTSIPPEKHSFVGRMSSVGNLQNDVIFFDSVGQRLLKYNRESSSVSSIHFSNLGVLGVPYWLNCPIERVFHGSHFKQATRVYNFSVLPGRCRIRINVEIPKDTELVAPLDENCIWRQARGSAAEISGLVGENTDREKVGVAQQWFDELDNLAFSNSGLEPIGEVDDKSMDQTFQDMGLVHFFCDVNVCPGTSEVIVSAALYLRANSSLNFKEVASMLVPQENEKGELERECISFLLEECGQSSGIIFTKPLYLRIKLVCGDHPTAPTSRETILTDTTLEVNAAMD
ncbi:hypothetical protein AXF42_Ash002862 [Apostasia shenzhenica]|uniref:Uncharacterized protein n=1 Tax=Apostasia shenzhenica TaxID=1088818 RepID=A0A2I0A7H5_9ASPA|nr:hypothetical protein AXF42_Ash002862 [Apostasia shenzhenica]